MNKQIITLKPSGDYSYWISSQVSRKLRSQDNIYFNLKGNTDKIIDFYRTLWQRSTRFGMSGGEDKERFCPKEDIKIMGKTDNTLVSSGKGLEPIIIGKTS